MAAARRVVAFDMGQSIVGTYVSHARCCGAFRLHAEGLSQLVSLLYSADVIVTFSCDKPLPDYDRYSLAKACEEAKVVVDMKRIERTYCDVRPLTWRSSRLGANFGRGLTATFANIFGGPVGNVRGMSADDYVRNAQGDAYMAYRLWRKWHQTRAAKSSHGGSLVGRQATTTRSERKLST